MQVVPILAQPGSFGEVSGSFESLGKFSSSSGKLVTTHYPLWPIFGAGKLPSQLCVLCAKLMRKTRCMLYGPVERLPACGTHLHCSIMRSPPPHPISLTCFLVFCKYKMSFMLKSSLLQRGYYGTGETPNILAGRCILSDSFVPWQETCCKSILMPKSLNQFVLLLQ